MTHIEILRTYNNWRRDMVGEKTLEDFGITPRIIGEALDAVIKDAESRVPLYEAVERACTDLPDGWSIQLVMEKGAGWVELYDDCGVHCDDFPTDNERIDYTVNDAIDAAISTESRQ